MVAQRYNPAIKRERRNPKINERKMSQKVFDLYQSEGNKLPAHTGYGGYPIFYASSDGAVLCNKCATDYIKGKTSGAQIGAYDANYEDPDLYCDDCGKRIPSAYAEDEAERNPVENPRNPDRLRLPDKYKGVSISWGTLNHEHILDAFIDFADSHRKYVGTKVNLREAKAILKRIKSASVARNNSKLMDAYEDAGEMITAFEDAFNEIAPIGTYFGSLEGDGSDLGFWSWEDE